MDNYTTVALRGHGKTVPESKLFQLDRELPPVVNDAPFLVGGHS
jgi:hypothetical protein